MATPSARTQRLEAALKHPCPRCEARTGDMCIARRKSNGLLKSAWPPHKARVDLVEVQDGA